MVAAERGGKRFAGLSSEAARALQAQHGRNVLVPERRKSPLIAAVLKPLADPMALLLLVAGATYVVLGDRFDATVTLAALVPVSLVTVVLEGRAERALERLRRLTARNSLVWRDGTLTSIPAEDVVPGDDVFIKEGDVVPADGALIDGSQLAIDESSLTGESQPADKTPLAPGDASTVLAGTTVLSGRGTFVVRTIGAATRYGAVGRLVAGARQPPTPMQVLINRFVRSLALGAVAICLIVAGIEAWRGHSFAVGVIAGVSLAMAAIPEEFPMIYALYLALGAWRLARDNALIRRLASVETLGSTTVICTDKTGTLTTGTVEVAAVAPPEIAHSPEFWTAAVLACEPNPFDPLDKAIVRAAEAHGVDVGALHHRELVRDYPFDTSTKTLTHVWRSDGRLTAFAKGAIEGIFAKAAIAPADRAAALAANERLARSGMRVLAVASGEPAPGSSTREGDERALAFLGLVAFSDPVRAGVAQTLDECREAGIRVIVITGDHAATASAVAASLGFGSAESLHVAGGDELDAASDAELARLTQSVTVFARTRPEQKHRLVQTLQRAGHVVAMTGDGTNDAPALREADIGIAMGRRGTEVAREAADLVLLDDDFSTIVRAVRDGRRIFDNLQRAFGYLIAFHAPLLLAAFAVPLVGAPLLLLPVHLVWLELIVHPTSSLVFEADPGEPDVMRRPPRKKNADLLPPGVVARTMLEGGVLAVAVLALYLFRLAAGVPAELARSEAIAALIVGQTMLVVVERRPGRPVWLALQGANSVLYWVVGTTLVTLVAAVQTPALADVLRLTPMGLSSWGIASATGLLATLWREPFKTGAFHSRASRPAGA